MIERDFIMRMVREVGQMLARVISKRVEERYEEDGAHIRVRAPEALLRGLRQDL